MQVVPAIQTRTAEPVRALGGSANADGHTTAWIPVMATVSKKPLRREGVYPAMGPGPDAAGAMLANSPLR